MRRRWQRWRWIGAGLAWTWTAAAPADTLRQGMVYFDSAEALKEAATLAAKGDNDGLRKMYEDGHLTVVERDREVILLTYPADDDPQAPAKFCFMTNLTPRWTFARSLDITPPQPFLPQPEPEPELSPLPPTPTPTPLPTPSAASSPTPAPTAEAEDDSTPDAIPRPPQGRRAPSKGDGGGEDPLEKRWGPKVWHNDNGHLRWYYKNRPPAARPIQRALPPEGNGAP